MADDVPHELNKNFYIELLARIAANSGVNSLPLDPKAQAVPKKVTPWILQRGEQLLPCSILHIKGDEIRIELGEPATIPEGSWAVLVAPGGKTRIAVEVGRVSPRSGIKCHLLGMLIPSPDICLECGRLVGPNEIVRRVAGIKKDSGWELCTRCWESVAARLLRESPPHLENQDHEDDDEEEFGKPFFD